MSENSAGELSIELKESYHNIKKFIFCNGPHMLSQMKLENIFCTNMRMIYFFTEGKGVLCIVSD